MFYFFNKYLLMIDYIKDLLEIVRNGREESFLNLTMFDSWNTSVLLILPQYPVERCLFMLFGNRAKPAFWVLAHNLKQFVALF